MPQRATQAEMDLLRARRLLRRRRPSDAVVRLAAAIECCEAAAALLVLPFGDVVADQALAELIVLTDATHVTSWDARGRAFARALEIASVERSAIIVAINRILRFLSSDAGVHYIHRIDFPPGSKRSA